MLGTIHIPRGNKVITVLLVKLFTCQQIKKPHNALYYTYR